MDFDDCKTEELLGAYLAGDVTDLERAAVETLLTESICAREERDELRRVYSRSKLANVTASSELLAKISQWATRFLAKKQTEEMLGAALTGDVSAAEKRAVEALLADNPVANDLNAELSAVAERAKAAQLPVGTATLGQLRDRLATRLPQAGLTQRATVTLSRRITPSMRIFLRQESQFKRRLWIGAAAAILLLAASLALWKLSGKNSGPQIAGPGVEPHNPEQVIPSPSPETAPVENPVVHNDVAPREVPAPPEHAPVVHQDVLTHNDAPKNSPSTVASQTAKSDPPIVPVPVPSVIATEGPQPNSPVAPPRDPLAPANTNAPLAMNVNSPNANAVSPNSPATIPVLPPRNPLDPTTGNTPPVQVSTGGPPITPTPSPVAPSPITSAWKPPVTSPLVPSSTPPIPPVDNAAVVGARQGGGVSAHDSQGVVESTSPYATLTNGSLIQTGAGSSVGLVLPKNGRLFVNQNSSLTINFAGANTTVVLTAGEIYYIAPGGGKLALTAGNDALDYVREADVSIAGGQLSVANFPSLLACDFVTAKSPHGKVSGGSLGTSALDGSGAVLNLAMPNPAPGAWHVSVLCPGDGLKQARFTSSRPRR